MDKMSQETCQCGDQTEKLNPDYLSYLTTEESFGTPTKQNLVDGILKDQIKTELVEKDSFLSVVGNSQQIRNVSVMKAEQWEQQARDMLEMGRLKKERKFLYAIPEAKIAESEENHLLVKETLKMKIWDLEEQLTKTRRAFQREIDEKSGKWKEKEEELTECLKREKFLSEKLSKENADLNEKLSQKNVELKETVEGLENAKTELKDLMDFHNMELMNMREDHRKLENERKKKLTLEMIGMQDLIEKKEKLCGILTTRGKLLQLKREKAENEKQDCLSEKAKELARVKDSLQVSNVHLDEVTLKYEKSIQRITKLKLEMSRLIKEVVKVKVEHIDLKSDMNAALQKGDFYKERYIVYAKQLAELQREKADKEAELVADIQEKKTLIEYLREQFASSTASGNKKKRQYFH